MYDIVGENMFKFVSCLSSSSHESEVLGGGNGREGGSFLHTVCECHKQCGVWILHSRSRFKCDPLQTRDADRHKNAHTSRKEKTDELQTTDRKQTSACDAAQCVKVECSFYASCSSDEMSDTVQRLNTQQA